MATKNKIVPVGTFVEVRTDKTSWGFGVVLEYLPGKNHKSYNELYSVYFFGLDRIQRIFPNELFPL